MATVLRMYDKNASVGNLQRLLNKHGANLAVDNSFGPKTERAVRAFQSRHNLVPDGIAGPKTFAVLNAEPAARPGIIDSLTKEARHIFNVSYDAVFGDHSKQVAKTNPPSVPPTHASGMHISQKGLDFIYVHEAWKGVSNRLHWPGGASGVTLGPGYDMKERSAATIEKDMLSIGVTAATAKLISGGARLTGQAARNFCASNKKTVYLTEDQERKLLVYIVPAYERIVRAKITVTLLQHQFDALVSFAYNPAGRMNSVAALINQGKTSAAMAKIMEGVTSGGKVMQGLVSRRKHEVNLYVNGIYAKSAVG